jgi:putative FmdB family regulatory protein
MPTYEFRCPKGHEFEKFYRSMSAAQLQVPCPTCGKIAERQVSAGAGLVFKGSGFYITDYGKDGKKAAVARAETAGTKDSATSGGESSAAKGETAGKAEPVGKSEPAGKGESSGKVDAKPSAESKSSGDAKPATASKSAAKKSSRAKSAE